jgi:uncharacterized protein YdeI (YjbR/CyaY-like superfamily)
MMITDVNVYFTDGCGRCKLFGTPDCKVNTWSKELKLLRTILQSSGLTEEAKWGMPTYTFQKKNVAMIVAFKNYCGLSFFKGALLADSKGILSLQGESVQSARLVKITNVKELIKIESSLKTYIQEAIEVEKKGLKVELKPMTERQLPSELEEKFKTSPDFKKAFYALTPGRQRGYLIHFSQPKQSATRVSRIEKSMQAIFAGKGMQD